MSFTEEQGVQFCNEVAAMCKQAGYDKAYAFAASRLNNNFNCKFALYALAQLYRESENYGTAFNLYRASLGLGLKGAAAWGGMGLCNAETYNFDLTEKCFRKGLEADKNEASAWANMALFHVLNYEPEKAIEYAKVALRLNPALEEARHHLSYANLMLRNWREGWEGHSLILGKVKTRTESFYEGDGGGLLPRWDGTRGKQIIVYGEQGIGDEISFASCLPDAIRDSSQVTVDCDKRLEGLFRRSFRSAKVYGTRFDKQRAWLTEGVHNDARCAIGDLPRFYRNADSEFPGTPYLVADPERRIQWRALFDTFRKPVIGIAWNGGINNTGKKKRSLGLTSLLPIMKSIPATWISLEYRDRTDQIQKFREETGIEILDYPRATRTNDYDDTAGLVAELDLVVTVTTAVVHLAGALGKECWCLAPNKPRWFYGLEGDLPWYKSVKMFRQAKGGEWPVEDIAKLLKLRYE